MPGSNPRRLLNFRSSGPLVKMTGFWGFASYGRFRNYPANKYSVEHSVYIHEDHRGGGWAAG